MSLNTAEAIGEACAGYVAHVLEPGTVTGLRKAQKVLRLAERYGTEAIEAACRRAASYENWQIAALEAMVERQSHASEDGPLEVDQVPAPPLPAGFARSSSYFAHDPVQVEASA